MMLQRKRKTKDPCQTCFLHKDRCICGQIHRLETKTRVCLVIHAKELKRTTNTGRLALHSLANSEMRIRGQDTSVLDLSSSLLDTYHPLFLFPSEDAMELNEAFVKAIAKPVLLIVPDGNWRQASKVQTRHPELSRVQRVFLKKENALTQTTLLRTETVENGMATLEAIAQAMSVLESPQVGSALQQLYQIKLTQTLLGRGQNNKM
ncbi:DTW domain-containing protein [bacterium]|nr:DTW domain-containing protein [bacterium]